MRGSLTLVNGGLRLDMESRELHVNGQGIRLQEQPYRMLRLLLERGGGIVTRAELRQELWPDGTYVDFEHSINAAMKRLRAVLGETAGAHVETVPRRGYRLIVARHQVAAAPRLAVRSFIQANTTEPLGALCRGLMDEIVTELARVAGRRLIIVSRSSSLSSLVAALSARDAAQKLDADYLLDGSVRIGEGRVRVVAVLVSAADEAERWSKAYDERDADLLTAQARLARRIARAVVNATGVGREMPPPQQERFTRWARRDDRGRFGSHQ